jgi:hypothetical protein
MKYNDDEQWKQTKQEYKDSIRYHKLVNESVAAYSRWNGDVTVYISPFGTSVVNHKDKTISTAYRSEEYDEKFNKLLEVLNIDKVSTDKR